MFVVETGGVELVVVASVSVEGGDWTESVLAFGSSETLSIAMLTGSGFFLFNASHLFLMSMNS